MEEESAEFRTWTYPLAICVNPHGCGSSWFHEEAPEDANTAISGIGMSRTLAQTARRAAGSDRGVAARPPPTSADQARRRARPPPTTLVAGAGPSREVRQRSAPYQCHADQRRPGRRGRQRDQHERVGRERLADPAVRQEHPRAGHPAARARQARSASRNGHTTGPPAASAGLRATRQTERRRPPRRPALAVGVARAGRATLRLLERTAIAVVEVAHRDQDDVDDVPDPEPTAGDQLEDAEPDAAEVEPVHPQRAEEDREQQGDQPLLVENSPGTCAAGNQFVSTRRTGWSDFREPLDAMTCRSPYRYGPYSWPICWT